MRSPRLLVLAAALAVAGCSAPSGAEVPRERASAPAAAASAPAPSLPAPQGLRVAVEGERAQRADGLVDWSAAWVLTWEPVPGAEGYAAHFTTSEGGEHERELTAPRLHLDAAAGTSPPDRVEQDQAAQLALGGSQLLVSVAAEGPGEAVGAPSAWFRVGDVPAGGVPLPEEAPGGHGH